MPLLHWHYGEEGPCYVGAQWKDPNCWCSAGSLCVRVTIHRSRGKNYSIYWYKWDKGTHSLLVSGCFLSERNSSGHADSCTLCCTRIRRYHQELPWNWNLARVPNFFWKYHSHHLAIDILRPITHLICASLHKCKSTGIHAGQNSGYF